MLTVLALACVALLAYANGANDNFKGVATLFGSGVSDYRRALWWATGTTLCGSLVAVALTSQLVETFSGKLFVDAATLATSGFALAFPAACAATVLLATRIGAPISTTHALAGSLLGAAMAAPESMIDWSKAGNSIFLPLAVGPFVALAGSLLLYPLLTRTRKKMGIRRDSCVCVGEEWIPVRDGTAAASISASMASEAECQERYQGRVLGLSAHRLLDSLHYLSAGLVSFARGVNDTPKIVAVTLMAAPFTGNSAFALVGIAIAAGGLLGAQRVAQTMSQKITAMNPGQGLTANLITSGLVITASPLGMPLSTTHVSCGALFGIGAVTGQARWRTIAAIVAAWLITLPLGAALGAIFLKTALWLG